MRYDDWITKLYISEILTMKLKPILESISGNIVAYHGTDSKFDSFNDNDPIFFVNDPKVAKTYGNIVKKVQLTIDNPIEFDFEGKSTFRFLEKWYLPSDLAKKIKEISDDIKKYGRLDDDFHDELQQLYDWSDQYGDLDGIIMKDINDPGSGWSDAIQTNYVVFSKTQIKPI